MCGQFLRVASEDGSERILGSNKETENFDGGRICRYRIEYPETAGDYDRIKIVASSIVNVDIHAAVTGSFPNLDYEETVLELNKPI